MAKFGDLKKIFSFWLLYFLQKRRNFDRIFILQSIFRKMAKIQHQKNKFNDVPMDDRHFGYITKMENKKHTGRCFFSGELKFSPFCEKNFQNKFCHKFPFKKPKSLRKNRMKKKKARIATITSNMKGCFRFDTFMFRISPNLAKYTNEPSPPEQRHKIDPKNSPKKKNTAAQWPTDHGSVG